MCMLAITIIGTSCSGPTGPSGGQGPAGPILTGAMSGFIYLVDQNDSLLANRSGAVVTIGGTNFSATTDSTGKWTISNVPTGTYTITFAKSGYDSFLIPSQQFVGGGSLSLPDLYLVQKQTFQVTSETVKDSLIQAYNENVLSVIDSISEPEYTTGKRVAIFIGTTPSVSSNPATYEYSLVPQEVGVKWISRLFSRQELVSAGLPSGSTIYFISYGESEYASTYRDTATGRSVYCGLSYTPSKVVSAIVP